MQNVVDEEKLAPGADRQPHRCVITGHSSYCDSKTDKRLLWKIRLTKA